MIPEKKAEIMLDITKTCAFLHAIQNIVTENIDSSEPQRNDRARFNCSGAACARENGAAGAREDGAAGAREDGAAGAREDGGSWRTG